MRADFGLYGSGLQIVSYPLEVRMSEPQPFKLYKAGTLLHGTKADLAVGDLLVAGYESNFEAFPVLVTDGDRRGPLHDRMSLRANRLQARPSKTSA